MNKDEDGNESGGWYRQNDSQVSLVCYRLFHTALLPGDVPCILKSLVHHFLSDCVSLPTDPDRMLSQFCPKELLYHQDRTERPNIHVVK